MVQSIPDKVLYGSDVPENISVELSKIKSLNLPESVLQKVLCDNALKLFKKITI
jgi:predicted TIM-barrel fold metal-dependent hydrolase